MNRVPSWLTSMGARLYGRRSGKRRAERAIVAAAEAAFGVRHLAVLSKLGRAHARARHVRRDAVHRLAWLGGTLILAQRVAPQSEAA